MIHKEMIAFELGYKSKNLTALDGNPNQVRGRVDANAILTDYQ